MRNAQNQPPIPISGYLFYPNGTRVRIEQHGRVSWIEDRNGNRTTFSNVYETNGQNTIVQVKKITDSLGREVKIIPENDPAYGGHHEKITYKGFGGQGRVIRASWQHIWMPDGRKFNLYYNDYYELIKIETPTGAKFEYVYSGEELPAPLPPNSQAPAPPYRRVSERKTYNGNNLEQKTLFTQVGGSTSYSVTQVDSLDISGNLMTRSKHYFHGDPTPILPPTEYTVSVALALEQKRWNEGREYSTETFAQNGTTLLRKKDVVWENNGSVNWYSGGNININPRVSSETISLSDVALVSKTEYSYASDSRYNVVTDTYEYDYGTTANNGNFSRRSHRDFISYNQPLTNLYLLYLPTAEWVSSDLAGNNKASLKQFEYDNYAGGNNASLEPRENVIGHDTTNYGQSKTNRGNVTKITTYGNAQNQTEAVSVYSNYDILGNIVKTYDAKNNVSTIDYTDRFASPDGEAQTNTPPVELNEQKIFAFPTSATNALNWIIGYSQFDYYTGKVVDVEDLNGVVSSTFYNDPLDRPTQMIAASNQPNFKRQTTIIYDDDEDRRVEIKSDLNAFTDNLLKSESFYDGLGRTIENRKYESGGGYIATKSIPFLTTQDQETGIWRAATKASNPYRQNETPVWTTSLSDSLGRAIKAITPDGAVIKTEYSGNAVTVTDQAGKKRRSITNALGQLIRVDEPDNSGSLGTASSPNQPTNYTYDVLNNLLTVSQVGTTNEQCGGTTSNCTQSRTFVYDSLSRLKSASNPESGMIQYVYDNNGNLTKKTDARLVETNYVYDALNRVAERSYQNEPSGQAQTPTVNYTYENTSVTALKGVLTKVGNGFAKTEYQAFDIFGRVTQSQQTTDGASYGVPMTYTYNLSGALIEQKYPSGRVVKSVLDNDGDLSIVQSKKNENAGFWNYAQHFTYTAAGAVTSMQLGNGRWESAVFNSRLQPEQIALGTIQNGTDKLKLNYEYGTLNTGNGQVIAGTNNGNVGKQTITVPNRNERHCDAHQLYGDAVLRL